MDAHHSFALGVFVGIISAYAILAIVRWIERRVERDAVVSDSFLRWKQAREHWVERAYEQAERRKAAQQRPGPSATWEPHELPGPEPLVKPIDFDIHALFREGAEAARQKEEAFAALTEPLSPQPFKAHLDENQRRIDAYKRAVSKEG